MAEQELHSLFGVAAIELHFHFGSWFGGVNPPAELVGRQGSHFVELDDEIAQLNSGEVGGAVIDYPPNFQSPLPAV